MWSGILRDCDDQAALDEMMADPDRARAKRVSDAMLTMITLDVAAPELASRGERRGA